MTSSLPPPQIGDIWYRAHGYVYVEEATGYDDFSEKPVASVTVMFDEYRVTRVTNACVILDDYGFDKRVLKVARKRYAYPTKQLAYASLIRRTQFRMMHAKRALDYATALNAYLASHGFQEDTVDASEI